MAHQHEHAHEHAHDASLADLVADGLLDAELAALAWALACGGVGILVASPGGSTGVTGGAGGARAGGASLAAALADAVSLTTRVVHLGPGSASGPVDEVVRGAGDGAVVLTAPDLGGAGEGALRRAAARAAIRAVSDRTGLALVATIGAPDLEGVLDRLRGLSVAAPDDEIVRLGVVLVLGEPDAATPAASGKGVADGTGGAAGSAGSADGAVAEGTAAARSVPPRVVAAHYLRPPAVGPLGRVERRPPAVLATFDVERRAWDHFGWGIVPDLAERVGLRPSDVETAVAIRREMIEALLAHGLRGADPFRAAAKLALPARRA
jgi:hypothetical protein